VALHRYYTFVRFCHIHIYLVMVIALMVLLILLFRYMEGVKEVVYN